MGGRQRAGDRGASWYVRGVPVATDSYPRMIRYRGCWTLDGTCLTVRHPFGPGARLLAGWVTSSPEPEGEAWISRNALDGVVFPTRRALLKALAAAGAADPMPARPTRFLPTLRRVSAGHHVTTDGQWHLHFRENDDRRGRGWQIQHIDEHPCPISPRPETLHLARMRIADRTEHRASPAYRPPRAEGSPTSLMSYDR